MSNCKEGILLTSPSHNNILKHNFITSCSDGISIFGDENNIFNNTILDNLRGAYFASSSNDNFLFFNNFINNGLDQALDQGTGNKWSSYETLPQEYYLGNYWSDYDGIDVIAPIGFGDTPYNVTGDIIDEYPLINEATTDLPPPIINQPFDLTYITETTGHILVWSASSVVSPSHYTTSP